jgi:hypothetical protein
VAHVLPMAALEIRDPVTFVVLVEPDDMARHGVGLIHHSGT